MNLYVALFSSILKCFILFYNMFFLFPDINQWFYHPLFLFKLYSCNSQLLFHSNLANSYILVLISERSSPFFFSGLILTFLSLIWVIISLLTGLTAILLISLNHKSINSFFCTNSYMSFCPSYLKSSVIYTSTIKYKIKKKFPCMLDKAKSCMAGSAERWIFYVKRK